nr:MAG TPA: hypothetical protein [Caudoviricetes sp.]
MSTTYSLNKEEAANVRTYQNPHQNQRQPVPHCERSGPPLLKTLWKLWIYPDS